MTRTQQMSPAEANAIIRRRQWQAEAEKARDRSWLRAKRFDLIDLVLLTAGIISTGMLILAFI